MRLRQGARKLVLLAALVSSVSSLGTNALTQVCAVEEAALAPPVPDDWDEFGFSVGLSAGTAVVGAPGFQPGFAHVYVRSGTDWIREASLTSPGGWFGYGVAIDVDTLISTNGADLWVFERNGTVWSEEFVVQNSAAFNGVGHSVSVSGDTFVAGAPSYPHAEYVGAAYVFRRVGTAWRREARLNASDAQVGASFGYSVAIEDDTLIVGALDGGKAYVFTRAGSVWTEQATVHPVDAPQERFGHAVAVSGDTLAVGAPKALGASPSTGAAYVFRRSGTGWVQQAKLFASDGVGFEAFGFSISIDENEIAVGAIGAPNSAGGLGAVYGFRREAGTWIEASKVTSGAGADSVAFGFSVAIDGNDTLVGESRSFAGVSGAAYMFDETLPRPTAYCTAKLSSCGNSPAIGYAGAPSASASAGFVVSAKRARGQRVGVLLYTDAGRAAVPFQGGLLCIDPASLRRTPARHSAGSEGECDGALSIDMNAFASGNAGGQPAAFLTSPGTQVNCQWWGRDTLSTGSLLSDGLEYSICP